MFNGGIRDVVETDLTNWRQKKMFEIYDSCRRVRRLLGRNSIEPSRCRKEQGEYGKAIDLSKNATQLRKQSPLCAFWVIGEDVGLIKRDDDKWSPWSFDRIQHAVGVYKFAESISCLYKPLAIDNVSAKT